MSSRALDHAGRPQLSPIYMWAGGKGRLLRSYAPLWPAREGYDRYVEPFFGAGAVYAWMKNAHPSLPTSLGDVNAELVVMLRALAASPAAFIAAVADLVDDYLATPATARKAWYYALRSCYWDAPSSPVLFVLMRLSFNGIWQTCVASGGLFGTPAGLLGHKRADQVAGGQQLYAWAGALADTYIHAGSYDTLPFDPSRALVYLDPPYRGSFTSYGTGFDDADQVALATWYRRMVAGGARVLLANRCVSGDTFFEDLLGDIATFHYFNVTYTAGRRKVTAAGFAAMPAREFLAISR